MAVAEFDFETLEPLAPPVAPADQAAAVMDVLAEARAEADALREAARAEGFAAGRAEAMAALEPALAALGGAVEAGAGRAGRPRPRRSSAAPSSWASRWRRRSSPARWPSSPSGSSTRSRARCAGSSSASASPCSSTPTTWRSCTGAIEGVKASLGGIEHCVVEAERRVARGGCIVRTPVGDVDARVETKLERAGEVIAAALGRS